MNPFQAKTKVNQTRFTILAIILCLMPFFGFIVLSILITLDLVGGGFWHAGEKLTIFTILPFLIVIPFLRIDKWIKIIPLAIVLAIGSIILWMFSWDGTLLAVGISIITVISIIVGYHMNKWAGQWNSKYS